jgi:class 3 adenylate cyclase
MERRLSAILAADVAGYSWLMHHNEEGTHAKLTALLTDAVEPAISDNGGRIVKNTGDGLLAEFPSAVAAVRAAVQFQTRIKELTTDEVEEKRIETLMISKESLSQTLMWHARAAQASGLQSCCLREMLRLLKCMQTNAKLCMRSVHRRRVNIYQSSLDIVVPPARSR